MWWLKAESRRIVGERAIRKRVSTFFDELRSEVLANVDVIPAATKRDKSLFDLTAAKARIAEMVSDDLRDMMFRALESAVSMVGENWELLRTEFDVEVERMLGDQLAKIRESVDAVDAELKARVAEIVQANAESDANEIHERLREGLGEKFDTLTDSRARLIARTSATSATTGGQRAAWQALEIEMAWLAQPGARPTHAAASGQRPDADGMFHVGDATGPGPGNMSTAGESCNCRCTLRPRPKKITE